MELLVLIELLLFAFGAIFSLGLVLHSISEDEIEMLVGTFLSLVLFVVLIITNVNVLRVLDEQKELLKYKDLWLHENPKQTSTEPLKDTPKEDTPKEDTPTNDNEDDGFKEGLKAGSEENTDKTYKMDKDFVKKLKKSLKEDIKKELYQEIFLVDSL